MRVWLANADAWIRTWNCSALVDASAAETAACAEYRTETRDSATQPDRRRGIRQISIHVQAGRRKLAYITVDITVHVINTACALICAVQREQLNYWILSGVSFFFLFCFLPARRYASYASAGTIATALCLCLSVCLSVTSRSSSKTDEQIELAFGKEASFYLS